ncbi:hypothetical protein P8Q88_08525 [Qipengyuania sp. XHP0207]|uniref:hypothetical protein n=1 Tax=Qipengyuania sp. XHP0207 TaxID=3038078 RepID=UPI00241CF4A8|nr:hypothetical protein [Qipengyuania sp. XHP0207]MDG5748225.1 hypothetical protein [Qipengyuania sp. XHP0207]
MDLPPAFFQFLGSLAAILVLSALAWQLKLGPTPRLEDDDAAVEAAEEAVSGFEPVAIGRDSHGHGALLRDAQGRILLLRPHGSHFAGRLLTAQAHAKLDDGALVIDTAEKRYGKARLSLADASAWMQAIEAIKTA